MADQHLIMAAAHDGALAERAVPAVSRSSTATTASNGRKAGGKDTYQRACDEVDARLARYRRSRPTR